MKVLMVCLGNICRSPLSEGILKHKAQLDGLNWEVNSAGTGNYHIGEPPHLLSQKVALAHGIDISQHKAQQFTAQDMLIYNLIYVMDADNYKAVEQISKKMFNPAKTKLIMNELFPDTNTEVPDPWFGTEKDFIKVYQMLDAATDSIIQKYRSTNTIIKNTHE
ncbi:low molecular weight protein-tyrosine-phosphatase [Hydrotalea sp.]|uniref:low molecular weight protein-tyrosine-phosphatase n=1 Tax=Hydrotalea sp. TaxID=2881279 RepID=UPI0026099FAD|nr:low molecular weight protein-tyrosine-phosphatase [Hydrotalea sp.]